MQWILESPPIMSPSGASEWLQNLYGTLVELDGRQLYVNEIESFQILESVPRWLVIAKVRLEATTSPFVMYNAEMNVEVDPDARRN